jgi:hypothetical protein
MKGRDIILAAIAAVVLAFVFVVLQGLLARHTVGPMLALWNILGGKAAALSVICVYGAIGSALSATLIALPLGWTLTSRPYPIGAIVGLSAVILLTLNAPDIGPGQYVEYPSLVIFSSLAAGLGNHLRRRQAIQ